MLFFHVRRFTETAVPALRKVHEQGATMADVHMNPEYAVRMIRTVSRVLAAGKRQCLFGDEADGWFCLATKRGTPIMGLGMGHLSDVLAFDYRHHAEEQVRWLSAHDLLTSSPWEDHNVSDAVAVTGYDFYFSYASALTNRLWNEAIMVVTAIRMAQFNEVEARNPRWHLKENPNIESLLAAAHWTE